MQLEEHGERPPYPALLVTGSWQMTLLLGVATFILGLVVIVYPAGSVNVIAVLLGVLLIISGIFHLFRGFNAAERNRGWLGVTGLVLIVGGVVLIRHLHLTVALIGLIIGISWIVQGLSALIVAVSGGVREGAGWWVLLGAIGLVAGIAVTATPTSSVTVLAVLTGIWFTVMGIYQFVSGFILRRAIKKSNAAANGASEEVVSQ